MQNLAGNPRATEIVAEELKRCGITPIFDNDLTHPEVHSKVYGTLPNGFRFRRNWYYYGVSGAVPLEIAKQLYNDYVGKKDIRVSGHCGCPAPEGWYVSWYNKDTGKKIIGVKNKEDCKRIVEETKLDSFATACQKILDTSEFHDDPASLPYAVGYVRLYHIDSELGLYKFVEAVKNLPKVELPDAD